jgi:hypothetical protein
LWQKSLARLSLRRKRDDDEMRSLPPRPIPERVPASEQRYLTSAEEPFKVRSDRRMLAYAPGYGLSRITLLTLAFTAGLLLYLSIEPTKPWILLVLAALVTLGTDGVMREHPLAPREGDFAWTAPLLFLPCLLVLGSGLFLEDALDGYWVLPGAFVAGSAMAAVLYAEHTSIDTSNPRYATARFLVHVGTYLTAFCVYAAVYSFDVSLVPAAICVGLASALLSVEILHEAEGDVVRALVYAGIVGLVVAEARWALYFLPIESYLAGVFLLLVFYLSSGLVQHHLNDDLSQPVLTEFAGIAALGVVIVTLGRIFEG